MKATLNILRQNALISALDVALANRFITLSRGPDGENNISKEDEQNAALAISQASAHMRSGNVCVDLGELSRTPIVIEETAKDGSSQSQKLFFPKIDVWQQALAKIDAIGQPGELKPLILDHQNRLYLSRYHQMESGLASAILSRCDDGSVEPIPETLHEHIKSLFPQKSELDWQRVAALITLKGHFTVISGGPGTGKTTTVVKLLALLVQNAAEAKEPTPHIMMMAPTGKAAARLAEAVNRAKSALGLESTLTQHIPEEASTIHRALGVRKDGSGFYKSKDNPLAADIILVDEASMVDLSLMSALFDAVSAKTRIILLGDKDQLASVEAGAVLGDICNRGEPVAWTAELKSEIKSITGDVIPDQTGPVSSITNHLVVLEKSYRYDDKSGIGLLARAINSGDADTALELLNDPGFSDISLVEAEGRAAFADLRPLVIEGFR
ncbi:exodeoxyribonuclease V subunit alpha, partial [Myxococcota bacterium]|nr:exodeoxyribonuclease V subunit alpha [Myxococcota bacterium]